MKRHTSQKMILFGLKHVLGISRTILLYITGVTCQNSHLYLSIIKHNIIDFEHKKDIP